MWRITIKNLLAHKRRVAATGTAVVLGVAFMVGTLVLGDTMDNGFANTFTTANAGTDVVIRSATVVGEDEGELRGTVDPSVLDAIADVDGVDVVVPQISGLGQIVGSDGEPLGGHGPPTFAGNWIADESLNPFRVVEGRAPTGDGEIVIDQGSAANGKLAVGDRTTVLTPAPVDVTVVGVAAFGEEDSIGGATFAFFTTDQARSVLGGTGAAAAGGISAVLVTATDGTTPDALSARIAKVLPDGVESLTGAQLTDEQVTAIGSDFLDYFKGFLVAFAAIAVLVATFSIHNTFSVVLAQRTRESALLRAVGATRRQVLAATATEMFVIGLVASGVGLIAGVGLASGLMSLLGSAGVGVPTAGLTVEGSSLWIGALVGIGATLVAGLGPSLGTTRVAPLAAIRNTAIERPGRVAWRSSVGVVLVATGLVTAAGPAVHWWSSPLWLIGVGAAAVLIGVVVLGPVLARPAAAWFGSPIRRLRGVTGGLAQQNAMRNPRRTASTATALMVGVGVVALFMVVGASLQASVTDSVARSMRADLIVQADTGPISEQAVPAIAAVDGVRQVLEVGMGSATIGRENVTLDFVDLARVNDALLLDVREGRLDRLDDHQVAIARSVADERTWKVGSSVELGFVDGQSERFTVGAIFDAEDFASGIVMADSAYRQHNTEVDPGVLLVNLDDGASANDAATAVNRVLKPYASATALTKAEFVDEASGGIASILTIVYVMLALSILIALMGIANTMSLSVHERTRELGLLRAIGQTRRQTRAMVRLEAGIISLFGTAAGVAIGVGMGWALVTGSDTAGVGVFAAPLTQLAGVLVIGGLVGVLAGRRPAKQASRLNVLDAISGG